MNNEKNNAAPDPQPAELAEQQGEVIVQALADAYAAGAEGLQFGGLARMEALAAALAATGKQQVGEVESVDDDWRLRGYAYASKQATTCAGCGKHKHTPLRIDAMGGYVCLTCIDQKLGALMNEFGYQSEQVGEVQGDAREQFEVSYRNLDLTRDGQGYSASDTNYTWNVWQAALAANGKQQVGENPAWRDELVREAHARGLMEGLNSPRPQQVGEVQGVSLPPLPPVDGYDKRVQGHYSAAQMQSYAHAALAARQPVCGTCAEVIQPDGLTGTTCSCARQPQAGKYDQSAEDRFEQFVQAEIARSPDALRELGEYLGRVLDEDEFPQANSLLLQLATEYAAPPAQGIDLGQLERIRNELHAMSSQVPDEWIDPIVELQQDVQKLIDGKRDAAPGVANA